MEILFLISLCLIIYPYCGYPVILWLLSKLMSKKVKKEEIIPYVTLLISAYNEENVIRSKIENTLELDYPRDKLEIIVASESTDKTNEIVSEYTDKGIILHAFKDRQGKAATLYKVVPLAKGEIIMFSDANAMYKKDALRKIARNFYDDRIGCVSGRLCYKTPGDASSIGESEGFYWKYETVVKELENRLFSLLGANGSIFAIRKKLYFPISQKRGDDFELPIQIAIKGSGVVLEPEALSYEESSETIEGEFKRKVRIISWNIKSALILLKEAIKERRLLIPFQLLSHKLIRWFVPLWLILLYISNGLCVTSGLFWTISFLLQTIFYLIALFALIFEKRGKYLKLKIFSIPLYFTMVNYASLIGILRSFFRKEATKWQKTR